MKLKKLNLSIPSMDSCDCKSLMGGNGYMEDSDAIFGGEFPEIVITPPSPERPDEPDPEFEDREDNDYDMDDDKDANADERGDEQPSDNEGKSFETQIQDIVSTLPVGVQNFVNQHNIEIKPGDKTFYTPGYVDANGNQVAPSMTIAVDENGNAYADGLLHELMHAMQDSMGILDTDSLSAEEFQAHALLDLYNFYLNYVDEETEAPGFYCTTSGDQEWFDFLNECFHGGQFDERYFMDHVMDYFENFHNSSVDEGKGNGYDDPLEDDYQWHWQEFLAMLGF